MEQFCSFIAVWVQIWPPYTLCKWKKIIEKSFWTGSFKLPSVSELSTIVTFYRLKQAMENGAMLLHFRCLCPNLPPYVDESKSLRRVYGQDPLICIGFGALNDGDILAP